MGWRLHVGSMLAVAACTSGNPAYQAPGEATEATSSTSEPAPVDSEPSPTGGPDSDATAEDSGELPPSESCRFDLYAINESGELYMLDPDRGDERLVLTDPRLESWAIATDPATGRLYVNERASPTTIWRVDPFVPEIEPDPLVLALDIDDVARATFHDGQLWLGTEDTHRFVWLPPSGGSLGGDVTLDPFARGGDMLFVDDDCAVVPTLDGMLYRVCFPAPGMPLPTVLVMDPPDGAQFNGIALDKRGRLWLSTADPARLLVRVEHDAQPWVVVETVGYGFTMNDLATVVHPLGSGC